MQVDHLPLWPAYRAEKAVGQCSQAVCFANDDTCVLTQFRRRQLALQKLGSTPQTTEWIANLVRELPDHATTGIVLADQCALAVDLSPLGCIEQLDDQIAVTGTGGADPHRQIIGGRAKAGCRWAEELAEAVAFAGGPLDEFVEISQLRQETLQ
jgi:hypothetical protein